MRILFGTLIGFFVNRCSAQDLPFYADVYNASSLRQTNQSHFEVTRISDYFYCTNSRGQQQIIGYYRGVLYKFDLQGKLTDTLKFPEDERVIQHIQSDNYFIYTENGFFPDWIKTGDETMQPYDEVHNADWTTDQGVLEKYREEVAHFSYKDPRHSPLQEYYDFLDERADEFALISLIKKYNLLADHRLIVQFSPAKEAAIFIVDGKVIRVNYPAELNYHARKIMGEKRLDIRVPSFTETKNPVRFEKTNWVKRNRNILATNQGGYWLGTAYYNLPVGELVLKLKVESARRWKNVVRVNRNVLPDNKYLILISTLDGFYLVKESHL